MGSGQKDPSKMSSQTGDGVNTVKDSRPKLSKVTGEQLVEEHLSYRTTFFVYFAFATFLIFGHIGRILLKIGVKLGIRKNFFAVPRGYAPLFKELQYFWLVWIYQRIRDLFERPIASVPGGYVDVLNRTSDDGNASFRMTGGTTRALNLSSYNYLGFAENSGPVIDTVLQSLDQYSFSTASARMEAGNYKVVQDLEKAIAKFVGKPAAMVFGMGFATNSTTIPALSGKGSLIISDSLNHASIVCGSKDSGAKIIVFKHNDVVDLEKILRAAIVEGQPRTRRPWKRIVIIVEGIYSMEGEIIRLPEIVALKKKYKAYLYVDEAHSIGALGRKGRGVCEHWGVNPDDVDVLMGTFTKAFGSVGGYISGSEELIGHLRHSSYGMLYSPAMSPPCAQQALSALRMIAGEDGTKEGERRLQQLHDNSNYFRKELKKRGFHVFGDPDSPIVPMMVYHPCKMPGLSRELLRRGMIVVLVGFPVTPLLLSRVRFCLSSAHSREDLEAAVKEIDELGDTLLLKYGLNKERHAIEDKKKQ